MNEVKNLFKIPRQARNDTRKIPPKCIGGIELLIMIYTASAGLLTLNFKEFVEEV